MVVERKIVRRDFSDHNDLKGTRYDVIASGKEPFDRDKVIGTAKFEKHQPFSNGVRGYDFVTLSRKVYERGLLVLFIEEELTEEEQKVVDTREKIKELNEKLEDIDL